MCVVLTFSALGGLSVCGREALVPHVCLTAESTEPDLALSLSRASEVTEGPGPL